MITTSSAPKALCGGSKPDKKQIKKPKKGK